MTIDTSVFNWTLDSIGKISIGHEYQQKLASIIPDAYVREHENQAHFEVRKHNQRIEIPDLLAQKERLITIIKETQQNIIESLSTQKIALNK